MPRPSATSTSGNPYEHAMVSVRDAASTDRIAVSFHGYAHTHLDGLAHHFLNGKMYNGFLPRTEHVTMEGGATKARSTTSKKESSLAASWSISAAERSAVSRARHLSTAEDLEAWEKKAGIRISAGDASVHPHRPMGAPRPGRTVERRASAAGLDASVIPWLRRRDIAVAGSESSVKRVAVSADEARLPIRTTICRFITVLVALGMPLLMTAS